jgi:exopolysaccharide production protein ExoQ
MVGEAVVARGRADPAPAAGVAALPRAVVLPPRQRGLAAALRTLRGAGELGFAAAALFLFSDALVPLLVEGRGGVVTPGEGNPLLRATFAAVHAATLLLVLTRARSVVRAALAHPLTPALVLLALVSVAWSEAPEVTLRRGAALAATTAFGLYLAARWPLRTLLRLLAWALGAAAVLSVAFALLLPAYGLHADAHEGAWRGVFTHKNTLGQVMALAAVLFFVVWRDAARLRWLPAAGLALAVALVVLSGSASALAVLAACGALVPVCGALRRGRGRGAPLLLAAVVVLGAAATLVLANLDGVLALLGREATLTGRTVLWTAAWEAAGERPWLGFGYAAFWLGWGGGSAEVWHVAGWDTPHAHNGFLDLMLDLGGVGVALLLAGLAVAAGGALRTLRRTPGPEGAWPLLLLALLLLYNLSESAFLRPNSLFWVLYVAVACASMRAGRTEPRPGPAVHAPLSPGVRWRIRHG